MLRVEFGHFRVTARRVAPVLLFETQMAEAGLNFDWIFTLFRRALQFFDGLVQFAFGGQRNGPRQRGGRRRALLLGGIVKRISAHQLFDQVIIDKKNV